MDVMKYYDLCDFLMLFEQQGELKCIMLFVDFYLEIMEIVDCMLCVGGLVLLFENFKGYVMLVLCNFFGMLKCVVMGMGQDDVFVLWEVGKLLVFFKEFELLKGFCDLFDKLLQFK